MSVTSSTARPVPRPSPRRRRCRRPCPSPGSPPGRCRARPDRSRRRRSGPCRGSPRRPGCPKAPGRRAGGRGRSGAAVAAAAAGPGGTSRRACVPSPVARAGRCVPERRGAAPPCRRRRRRREPPPRTIGDGAPVEAAAATGSPAGTAASAVASDDSASVTRGRSFSGSIPGQPRTATTALRTKSAVTAAATRHSPAPTLPTKARDPHLSPLSANTLADLNAPASVVAPKRFFDAFDSRLRSTVIPAAALRRHVHAEPPLGVVARHARAVQVVLHLQRRHAVDAVAELLRRGACA